MLLNSYKFKPFLPISFLVYAFVNQYRCRDISFFLSYYSYVVFEVVNIFLNIFSRLVIHYDTKDLNRLKIVDVELLGFDIKELRSTGDKTIYYKIHKKFHLKEELFKISRHLRLRKPLWLLRS